MSRQIMVKNPNGEQEKVYDNQLYFMRFFCNIFSSEFSSADPNTEFNVDFITYPIH